MKQRVVTVSRQYGSGGGEIAQRLADKLGVPLYDKDSINRMSENIGIDKEYFDRAEEKRAGSFLFSLVSAHYGAMTSAPMEISSIITEDNLFRITARTIKELATEPCVILGRCADDVLRGKDIVRIFLCADLDWRVKRVASRFGMGEKEAATLIKKTDKRRANYYNSYACGTWGDASNYDVCINSSSVGLDESVKLLFDLVGAFNKA